jgi:hypothetical protein
VGRYDWRRVDKRRSKWTRYDRDDDETRQARREWRDDDDEDSGPPRYSGDSLINHAKSGGMMGSLLFWFVIWAFAQFRIDLLFIFLGIAILQGWSWNKADGKRKRKRAKRDDRSSSLPIGGAPPLDGSEPATPMADAGPPPLPQDQSAHGRLIRETEAARAQLSVAGKTAQGPLADNLRRMDQATHTVVAALQRDPSNLAHVQRMFTYYLPSAAQLLDARKTVAGTGNTVHQGEIDGMFARLADAFEDFVARINGTDIRSLEIDLKLLEQSLDAEFDPSRRI